MAETKTSQDNTKTLAALAWLFAPITSLIWMNEEDEFLRFHAKKSLSWGVVSIIGHLIGFVTSFLFIGFCLWPLWSIADLVVRIYGLVKALNGEKWEPPVFGNLVK